MYQFKYYELVKNSKAPFDIRNRMIQYARDHGIKPAAREFSTTVKTVKKWLRRWENGNKHFKNESKKPKRSPKSIGQFWKFKIIRECEKARDNKKRINSAMLKRKFKIPYSLNTILRVMRESGFRKINKPKHERKRDLRAMKLKYKAFEKIQIDVKYLDDIPEMYGHYIDYKLPKYQYTARCIRTGALYISYGRFKTQMNSCLFLAYVVNHIKNHGYDLDGFRIQTDNGSEFIGSMNKKTPSAFTELIESADMIHRRIPPGAKTWQSDVESSHRLIEDEFYSYEMITSFNNFFYKAAQYQKDFNTVRHNSYKGGTPQEILEQVSPSSDPAVLVLKPILLDDCDITLRTLDYSKVA